MKRITKTISLIILTVSLGLFTIYNVNDNDNTEKKFEDLENYDEFELKKAGYWEIGPIEIDNDDPLKNWSIIAATYEWCNGLGTFSSPYIIENVTIDGQNTYNCIRIDNSNVYFRIRNCTSINGVGEYWHSGGIRLENVSNGRIVNNICSFNQQGIYLTFSNNNTISGNTANNNTIYGIVLNDQCNYNEIVGNNVYFNGQRGIQIVGSNNNNLISRNNASNNLGSGIYVAYSNDSKIINNTANYNGVYPIVGSGISVSVSHNITITHNKINNNDRGISMDNNQDCLIYNNTAISNEDYGINIERCNNFDILNNIVSYNYYGIMLRSESRALRSNYNNTVSGNVVKNSHRGIYLFITDNNTILENKIEDNYIGTYLRESNHNNVSRNILIGNDICIYELDCEVNIFENNDCREHGGIISGYNLFFLLGILSVVAIFISKKVKKS